MDDYGNELYLDREWANKLNFDEQAYKMLTFYGLLDPHAGFENWFANWIDNRDNEP